MLWLKCSLFAVILGAASFAQTTQPSDRAALEVRATQAFNAGNYSSALPVFQKLAELNKDQPDQLGPIEEKIRVCQRNLAAAPISPATQPSLAENRTPHPAPPEGQILEMSIKQLGNFDFDPDRGGKIPDDVVRLSGHKIKLRGFMIPMDQAENITQFALVPDLFSCCFGQPPQLQHTVVVDCPKGKAVAYYPDEISVEGDLNVAEKRDEGFIVSIFQVRASSVKPAVK